MGKDELENYLIENRYYYFKDTLYFILKTIIEEKNNEEGGFRVIGIDADSGYGKSYNARCLEWIINKYESSNEYDNSDKFEFCACPDELSGYHVMYISIDQYDYDDSFKHILYSFCLALNDNCKKIESSLNSEDITTIKMIKEIYEETHEIIINITKKIGRHIFDYTKETKLIKGLKFISEVGMTTFETFKESRRCVKGIDVKLIKEIEKSGFTKLIEAIVRLLKLLADNNFILIIDNIDRCAPRFTIKFIEFMKYLFGNSKILLLFMVNFEYLERIGEGVYGNNTDLHHFYNLSFTKIQKMYLKDRKNFTEDFIEIKELVKVKEFYKNRGEYIDQCNTKNRVSLFEIEKTLNRLENFLEKNEYLLLFNDNSSLDLAPDELIIGIYSLFTLQNKNIKYFNKLLFDYMNPEEIEFDERSIFLGKKFMALIKSKKRFLDDSRRILYGLDDNGTKRNDIYLPDTECKLVCNSANNGFTEVYVDNIDMGIRLKTNTLSFNLFFNVEDLQRNSLEKLLNFTFRDYLRYKISQF